MVSRARGGRTCHGGGGLFIYICSSIIIGGLIVWRVAPEGGGRMSQWRWLVC